MRGRPLGPRQEELLSYLQGLAPVGDMFEFRRAEVATDLGFRTDEILYEALRKLVSKGFVERLHAGHVGEKGRLKVLRRLESLRLDRPAPPRFSTSLLPVDAGRPGGGGGQAGRLPDRRPGSGADPAGRMAPSGGARLHLVSRTRSQHLLPGTCPDIEFSRLLGGGAEFETTTSRSNPRRRTSRQ